MESLLYKLFGVPRSFYEFYDKVGKNPEDVTITVGRYPCINTDIVTYFIKLDSKHAHFVKEDFKVSKFDVNYDFKKMGKIKIVKIEYVPTSDSEWRLKKAIELLVGDSLIRSNEAPSRKEFIKEKEILTK